MREQKFFQTLRLNSPVSVKKYLSFERSAALFSKFKGLAIPGSESFCFGAELRCLT